jgi:hypothetical protein
VHLVVLLSLVFLSGNMLCFQNVSIFVSTGSSNCGRSEAVHEWRVHLYACISSALQAEQLCDPIIMFPPYGMHPRKLTGHTVQYCTVKKRMMHQCVRFDTC